MNRVIAALLLLVPVVAVAHPGHDASGLVDGFLHPWAGMDHLLAMVAVGLWATRLDRRAMWTLPLTFPLAMVVGAALAVNGVVLPAIEPIIAASVIALGLLIAFGVRLPLLLCASLVGVFAVFHGFAHALEAQGDASLWLYGLGFVCATVLLHGLGIGVGVNAQRRMWPNLVRAGGAVIAVSGVALLMS